MAQARQTPELILTFFSDRLWLQLSLFFDYRKLDRCCPEFGIEYPVGSTSIKICLNLGDRLFLSFLWFSRILNLSVLNSI